MEIKRILVPTDFSEVAQAALFTAGAFAKKVNAELVVMHAIETYEFNTTLENLGLTYLEVLEQTVSKKLEELVSDNEALQGLKITQRLEKGKTHKVISEVATEENCDLIIMGTHGASGIGDFGKYMLGSNAYRTVNSSHIPVLTLHQDKPIQQINNILLPLDLSKATTQKVSTAIAMAKLFDASIHAITVSELFDDFNPKIDSLELKLDKVEEQITAEGIECTIAAIEHKDVANSVIRYAKENEIDLIAIMTRQENRINEFLLGSHSRKIVSQSPTPVLSLRPKQVTK